MAFKIVIQEVKIEEVRNGRNKYDKAEVVYSFNGQNRTQKLMSFSNPGVFTQVRNMKQGETYDVEVVKNDAGFNQWAKIVAVSGEPAPGVAEGGKPAPAGRTSVSTYETAEERKIKQMYIIKQSSISSAIEFYKQRPDARPEISDIVAVAQEFVDFVYGNQEVDLFQQDNDIPEWHTNAGRR